MIKLIVAHGHNGEIGINNQLLWYLPKDLAMFKVKTNHSKVCMGRLTFESLPFSNGLPNRQNYVISATPRKSYMSAPVVWMSSLESAIACHEALDFENKEVMWIVGGATIYKQAEDLVDEIHVTEVHEIFPDADTHYMPNLKGFYEDVGQRVDVSHEHIRATSKVYLRKQV